MFSTNEDYLEVYAASLSAARMAAGFSYDVTDLISVHI